MLTFSLKVKEKRGKYFKLESYLSPQLPEYLRNVWGGLNVVVRTMFVVVLQRLFLKERARIHSVLLHLRGFLSPMIGALHKQSSFLFEKKKLMFFFLFQPRPAASRLQNEPFNHLRMIHHGDTRNRVLDLTLKASV